MNNIININAKSIASKVEKLDMNDDSLHFDEEYDVTPIFENERLKGVVTKDLYDYQGDITDVIDIEPETIFGTNNTIDDILEVLEEFGYVILHGEKNTYYIVTESDLDKQAFRVYLFSLISNYEISITQILDNNLKIDKINLTDYLSEKRVRDILYRYKRKKDKNKQLKLIEEFNLVDKQKLLRKTELQGEICDCSNEKLKIYYRKINQLRNGVAHSKSLTVDRSTSDFIGIIEFLKRAICKVKGM